LTPLYELILLLIIKINFDFVENKNYKNHGTIFFLNIYKIHGILFSWSKLIHPCRP